MKYVAVISVSTVVAAAAFGVFLSRMLAKYDRTQEGVWYE
jgi:hypothetical protein